MTWVLIVFTWRLLPYVVPHQTWGTCVAHWVANTAVLMWYDTDAQEIADRLGIWFTGWYDPRKLPSALPEYNISSPVQLTSWELQAKLLSGPLIATVLDTEIIVNRKSIKSHTFAVLWKYATWSWIVNSRGTWFGRSWYGMMWDDQLQNVRFQTIGTGYVIPPQRIEIIKKLSIAEMIKLRREKEKRKAEEIKARRSQVLKNLSK